MAHTSSEGAVADSSVLPHIAIRNIRKEFILQGRDLLALDDVSLQIPPGEFVSFLGPSGCGKSTLMMLIAGLTQPSSGQVLINGHPVTKPVTDIGIVFQQDLLFDWRSVLDNIVLQAEVRGRDMAAARKRAAELLEQVGLKGFENRRPWELSGGMRQRVALCRGLLHDAGLMLLDEPFGALDALTRERMNLDLQTMWMRSACTAVLVTHSIAEAVFLSDRVILMSPRPGRVTLDLKIDLPRPRTMEMRDSPKFVEYQKTLRSMIGVD